MKKKKLSESLTKINETEKFTRISLSLSKIRGKSDYIHL